MNKKAIMANTIIFIISAIAVYISITHLGKNNLMVGISAIFLLVAIVNKDFSRTPIRAILKISFLTGFMGVAPYLVNLNIYTGLFINFIVVFVMLYLVVYTLNKTIYFPFLFGYTLLLYTNVNGKDLYLRIVGLIVVGIVAVLFQIILAKFNSKSEKNKYLIEIIDVLINNFEFIKTSKDQEINKDRIKELTTYWSRDILEKRNNSYFLKEIENVELNLIASVEKLDIIIEEFIHKSKEDKKYLDFLDAVEQVLIKLNAVLMKKNNLMELRNEIENLNLTYDKLKMEDIKVYEMIEAINLIDNLLDKLLEIEKKDYIEFKLSFKEVKEIKRLLIADFNRNSVRFIFAFRTALLVAIAYFVVAYFDLGLGKWMIFTITSVSQPYNDTVRGRAKGRLLGTLVGVAIYLPLSYIFTTVEARIVIIAIATYFMISFKKYAYTISMLTILFLGVVTINVQNILLFAWDRIFFVLLGIIIVLIANKFIFPYSLEKETKVLVKSYYDCSNEILEKTFLLYKKDGIREEIRNLILKAKAIENKILINNTALDSDDLREFRNKSRELLNNINNVLNRVEYLNKELRRTGYHRMNKIESMKNEIEKDLKNSKNILDEYLNSVEKTSERLIYIDVYEMILSRNKCKELCEKLI
ncbi:MAG: FUSC family protein [Sarcina sp.]